jgi:serine/threonine protein kinase
MDLKEFGILKRLTRGKVPTFTEQDLRHAYIKHKMLKNDVFVTTEDEYTIVRPLGTGSYGKTYEIVSTRTDAVYALKTVEYKSHSQLQTIIIESIVNIILERESATEARGPYVQRFYELGIDIASSTVFMRVQKLNGTLGELVWNQTRTANDTIVPAAIIQIANALAFFQSRLKMNHRDLKSDNIMYEIINDRIEIRFIDFGLSCLTWNGYHFAGSSIFPESHTCMRRGRDLSLFLLEFLLDFKQVLSPKLTAVLQSLATFNVRDVVCKLNDMCPAAGLKTWENSYDFLNRANVENPKASPESVRNAMITFIGNRKKN